MKLLMESWRKYLSEKVFADYSDGKKNKWVELPTAELTNDPDNIDITDEIYAMIDKSYAKIGGNVDIRSASDMPSDYDNWMAVDVDDESMVFVLESDVFKTSKADESEISPDDPEAYCRCAVCNVPCYFGLPQTVQQM